MTRRDLQVAAIAAGVGLFIIVVLAGIGLIQRANMDTSGGGQPGGSLFAVPTAAPLIPDANGNVVCNLALVGGRVMAHQVWGIAISGDEGEPVLTFWPHGYLGRVAGDRVELLDRNGQIVARVAITSRPPEA
jgi:hypothetical protein